MNQFDDLQIDQESFSWDDLMGIDSWKTFTPSFTNLGTSGTLSAAGRFKELGRMVLFQAQFSAGTYVASTAGTTYMNCVKSARGYGGNVTMVNATAKTSVGNGVIDVANSRVYLPGQSTSGNTFVVSGWHEA